MITEPTHPVADAAPTSCARMIRWLDHPRFVAWCLVIATGIRLAWAWRFDSTPTYDAAWYIEHGFTMLKGQFYGAWPTAYFPPGYPWFLSWCFRLPIEPMPAARLAHVALALATLWLILHVARLLFRDERVARLALLLAAAWPNGIVYGSLYMSENLFLPLMLAGVACLLHGERRWGWLIPAGLVLGLATLTRAQATLIPLVYFILTLRPALRPSAFLRWLGRAALVAALMLLTLAPWLARNRQVLGRAVLSSTGGVNLYIGNCAEARGTIIDTPWSQSIYAQGLPELQVDALHRQRAWQEIAAAPWRPIVLAPCKLFFLYVPDCDGAWTIFGLPRTAGIFVVYALSQVFYLLVWGLAVIGWRRVRPLPVLGLGIIIAFTLLYVALFGLPRYHLPMMPWLFMYAAAGWLWLMQKNRLLNE